MSIEKEPAWTDFGRALIGFCLNMGRTCTVWDTLRRFERRAVSNIDED
jgi:hypothetical protein